MILPLLLALAAGPDDSALAEIRSRYAKIQSEIEQKSCFQDSITYGVAITCPSGGKVMTKDRSAAGLVVDEFYLDRESAMFSFRTTKNMDGSVAEQRIYRLPSGFRVLARQGTAKTIAKLAQSVDTAALKTADVIMSRGFADWCLSGILDKTFPFVAFTVDGMAVAEQSPSIEASEDPVVTVRTVQRSLKRREIPAYYRQFIGKDFCEINSSRCASVTGFSLYSKVTPFSGDLEREQTEEEMIAAVTGEGQPFLVAELSSNLDGLVALSGFEPEILDAKIPAKFADRAEAITAAKVKIVEAKFQEYQKSQEGETTTSSWLQYGDTKDESMQVRSAHQSIFLEAIASWGECGAEPFSDEVSMAFGYIPPTKTNQRPAPPSGARDHDREKGEPGLLPGMFAIENPCSPTDCSITGPAFIPWNRSTIHIFKQMAIDKFEVIELDDDYSWQSRETLEIPFHDCGC